VILRFHGEHPSEPAWPAAPAPPARHRPVAQAFQPAGLRNFPVPRLSRPEQTGDWKVPSTRRQECLRYFGALHRWPAPAHGRSRLAHLFPHSAMAARGARIPHSKGSPCRRPRAAIGRPQDRHPQSNGPRQAINEKPSRSCKRGRRREDSPPKTSIRNHPVKARRRCESSRVPPKTGVVR
jgi:hypothetical protein